MCILSFKYQIISIYIYIYFLFFKKKLFKKNKIKIKIDISDVFLCIIKKIILLLTNIFIN